MRANKRKPQGATRTGELKPERRTLSERLPDRQSFSLPLKLLRGLTVIAVLVVVVMGGGRVLDSLDQPITKVQVAGALTFIDGKAVAQWVQGQITEGVLRTDLNSLQQQLQARPWVERVSVRRQWPGILHVSLREHVAVAHWNDHALLTTQGQVIEPQQLPVLEDAPLLRGVDSSSVEVLKQFARLQAELVQLSLQLVSVHKSERGAWQLQLLSAEALATGETGQNSLIEVALGKQQLDAKITRFKNLYHSVLKAKLKEIERVDLRYTNGVSVQWKSAPKVS